LTSDD
jgi:hypothetical protein